MTGFYCRNMAVGILTTLRSGKSRNLGSIPAFRARSKRYLSSPNRPDRPWGLKPTGREADNLPVSSFNVKTLKWKRKQNFEGRSSYRAVKHFSSRL